MLHPSYTEVIEKVNSTAEEKNIPEINSRYSIVIATAKRARQLIAGQDPMLEGVNGEKPLSIAVQELYDGELQIIADGEEVDEEIAEKKLSEAQALELHEEA